MKNQTCFNVPLFISLTAILFCVSWLNFNQSVFLIYNGLIILFIFKQKGSFLKTYPQEKGYIFYETRMLIIKKLLKINIFK